MSLTAQYPSGNNTFVPEVTSQYKVEFSRNPKTFPLNRYAQIVKVDKTVGFYPVITVEECARILSAGGANFEWADGNPRPNGVGGTESFKFAPYNTKRRDFAFSLGDLASGQASWDMIAQHGRIKAQQAMTMRTVLTLAQATTSGNYASTHRSAVSSITGVTGKWDVSTAARQDIKKSWDYAASIIRADTAGTVTGDQLKVVLSIEDARLISVSQEIVDFIKGSKDALEYIKNGLGPNSQYGLPERIHGYEVIVEDTYKVTSRKGATLVSTPALASGTSFMCSRVGGLEGVEGPNFSSLVLFMQEEMTVEQFRPNDNKDRRVEGHVTENYQPVLGAPATGFLFTAATG